MRVQTICVIGLAFSTCTVCVAQVDIYQSDAYSVEEMCAQEAKQSSAEDYSAAYEICIEKNSDNSLYQPDQNQPDDQDQSDEQEGESVSEEDAEPQAGTAAEP